MLGRKKGEMLFDGSIGNTSRMSEFGRLGLHWRKFPESAVTSDRNSTE
jgi:hypothetical protein